ncbi:hypothetical protein CH330_06730 [candidate division WOR-3 bacterium JGI_Cruoil_03_51_56]|uniref:Secretion system C-terminal sorting domain-containing protein n=1 Tax=candidate division WOR-3 bacterium JGI_Cruoil_03_51_56 TaxID=1973747 RepID=A0A235BTK0_UNCW3|nr:MAG: hypothetical protein CH330_06730 [candidate division WOR-3 bacterium JGI_Cruoil_03_51_56]
MRYFTIIGMFCALLGFSLVQAQTDSGYIGRVDTIGGTTYDWQFDLSVRRRIVNSPDYGIHVIWLHSADTCPFYNVSGRYNFYDYSARSWNWIDPDFMQGGVNVFTDRCGYPGLDADPTTGIAVISCHTGFPIHPVVARDMAPGGGVFEYCIGPEGYLWPVIAIGQGGLIHVGLIDDASREGVCYSQIRTWCSWDSAVSIAVTFYPDHNIASKVTQNVCLGWTDDSTVVFRISTDGGTTWQPAEWLSLPPAYSGDTVPVVFTWFPFYDHHNRLHILVDVMPYINGQGYIMPAEIWHWCPANPDSWSRIHRAGCAPQNLRAPVGYNAIYACRSSIGEDDEGTLFVSWEQFDSSNVEPLTDLLRAGIWLASSQDNGMTWNPVNRLTPLNAVSHRFPCIVDRMVAGAPDTVVVTYLMDPHAGFFVMGQGPADLCPIVCQFVPENLLGVHEERGTQHVQRFMPSATIVRGVLYIPDASGVGRSALSVLLDITGRKVADLHRGVNNIRHLAPGVYFLQQGKNKTTKVVIQR